MDIFTVTLSEYTCEKSSYWATSSFYEPFSL